MIKLVACDLDGTLLPPSKVMPEEIFEIIEKLHKKGVVFAPASGRQLPNLKKLFAPVLDEIAIIAENGGLAYMGGEVVFTDPTPSQAVSYALDAIAKESGLYPVVCCADCAYYDSDFAPFIRTLKRSYSSEKRVHDLKKIVEENTVIKISVWDERPAAEHGGLLLPPKIKGLRTMISGYDWLDVSVLNANKGKALNALAAHLGADKNEVMAFGDHMNDKEMLENSGHAYITANGFPALKESGVGEIIPSNAEYGVIQKLKELL